MEGMSLNEMMEDKELDQSFYSNASMSDDGASVAEDV